MTDTYILECRTASIFSDISYLLFQIERPNGNIVMLFLIVNIKLSLNVIGFLVNWLSACFLLKFLFLSFRFN